MYFGVCITVNESWIWRKYFHLKKQIFVFNIELYFARVSSAMPRRMWSEFTIHHILSCSRAVGFHSVLGDHMNDLINDLRKKFREDIFYFFSLLYWIYAFYLTLTWQGISQLELTMFPKQDLTIFLWDRYYCQSHLPMETWLQSGSIEKLTQNSNPSPPWLTFPADS